ncbi:MAG: HEPN domain-containing protein [Candidatus Nanohaloarchaea archaeon]
MEDVEKWFEKAEKDYSLAEDNQKIGNHGASMFFCHQSAEKALKALQLKETGEKSYSHNLLAISNKIEVADFEELLAELNPFYTGFRYPDEDSPEVEKPEEILEETGELLEWIKKQLRE